MELFDLEIPIRATGGQTVKAQFDELEAKAKVTDARISKPSVVTVEGTDKASAQLTALGTTATETAASVSKPATVTIDGIPQAVAQMASLGTAATEAGRFTVDAINREIAARMQGASAAAVEQETVEALRQAEQDYAAALKAGTLTAEQAVTVERELASVRKALAAAPGAASGGSVPPLIPPDLTEQATSVAAAILSIQTRAAALRAEFRASEISTLAYSRGMAALNAEVKALGATAGITETEQRALNALLVRTTTSASGLASQGLDVVRKSALAMAPAMLGAEGAVGAVAGSLLAFSSGGFITLGVVAGIGAIVAAYHLLTDEATAAKKRVDDLIGSLKDEEEQENRSRAAARAAPDLEAHRLQEEIRQLEIAGSAKQSDADIRNARLGGSPTDVSARLALLRQQLAAIKALQIADDARTDVRNADERKSALVREAEALADLIRLKGANAAETTRAEALERQLTAAGHDRTKSIEERNAALAAAGAIYDALHPKQQRHAATTEDATDALVRQTTALVSLAKLTGDTGGVSDQLRLRLVDLDTALQAGNLTIQQRVALLQAQAAATEEVARLTGAALPKPQGTFGLDTSLGQPKPAQLPTGFNQPTPTTPDTFAGGAADVFGKDADSVAKGAKVAIQHATDGVNAALDEAKAAWQDKLKELGQSLADGIGRSIGDGIEAGFAAVFSGGSIGAGFQALIGSLLHGIGSAMVSFGKAALAAAIGMKAIKDALSKLAPEVAIAASIGLIAVGTALGGAGQSLLAGPAQASFGGSSTASVSQPQVIAFPLGRSTASVGSTGSAVKASGITAKAVVHLQPIVIGSGDPVAQRQIVELVNNAQRRGYRVA